MSGKRIYRDDEEPETDWVPFDVWLESVKNLCEFCGHEGHKKKDCPYKP